MASIKQIKYKGFTWINIEEPDQETIEFLKKKFKFHTLDYKDILGEIQRPKIDVYNNYVFLVLHFPKFSRQLRKINEREIDIFLGKDYLITIQDKRHKILYKTFFRLLNNPKAKAEFMRHGPAILLYKLLESLYKNSFIVLDFLSKNISQLEDDVYREKGGKSLVTDLAITRRNILNLRKIIDPQRFVVNTLVHLRAKFFPGDMSIYFDDIHDYIEKIWVVLDNYKDIVDGLSVTNEAMISHRTNEVIKALTIISVSILPLSLLSGIYGMNIKLPFAGQPQMVWILFVALFFVIMAIIILMRKNKWL